MTRRLYRSSKDRMIAGVCGGLGEYLDIDPTLVRLLFVAAVLAGFGAGILIYAVLMFVMPLEENDAQDQVSQAALEPPPAETELEGDTEPDEADWEMGDTHL